MATSASRARTRTACDRCYELKEKCVRVSTTITCTRCTRLKLVCSSVRPVRVAGRRPRHHAQSVPETHTAATSSSFKQTENVSIDISTWLQGIPGFTTEEKDLLLLLLDQHKSLDSYVVSSSFQAAEQKSLAAPLLTSLPVLKDAYLAFAGALKLLQPGCTTENDRNISLRHASAAMIILRSLPVTNLQDAVLCLSLGITLALFVYSAIGVGVADICHFCLSVTSPYMKTASTDADATSWQIFLVLLETMECMVHRRKPTLRIQLWMLEGVDRHLGLAAPLLPYYYDLCVISHSLVSNSDASYLAHIQKQLDETRLAVEAWQPSCPVDFTEQFKSADVVNILAQAKAYRLAGLLVAHRLQYVFGQQDSQADIWAKEILMELELAHRITQQSLRCVTLPFIVAAVELRDPRARVKALGNVDRYVDRFTPVIQKATKVFLGRIWQERDLRITACWFDSVYKPCALLSSIDAASFG